MKIGVIASIAHRTPPADYQAWGHIAHVLTEGFVARGHDVTLFATANSNTSAWLNGTVATAFADGGDLDQRACEALHTAAAFERAGEFDILANHSDFLPLSYSRLVSTPMVTTVRGVCSPEELVVYRAYDDIGHYVSVSDAARRPDLHYAATIRCGIDAATHPFAADAGKYLLCLDDIHPDKGTHLAIEVAKRAGVPLIIAGAVHDKTYFRQSVQPHLDGTAVVHAGAAATLAERSALLADARALLHLVNVAEPLGLSVIEALAAGTPVIATPLGCLPEFLRESSTGLLVSDPDAAVAAIARVGEIDRAACRQEAVSRFGAERMVEEYLALFERIRGAKTPRHPGSIQSIGSPGLFSHAGH